MTEQPETTSCDCATCRDLRGEVPRVRVIEDIQVRDGLL